MVWGGLGLLISIPVLWWGVNSVCKNYRSGCVDDLGLMGTLFHLMRVCFMRCWCIVKLFYMKHFMVKVHGYC